MILRNPQTIANAVFVKIDNMIVNAEYIDPNGFFYLSVSREISSLMHADPYNAYLAKAFLNHLTGQIDITNQEFERAKQLGPKRMVELNRAIALSNLGYFSQAQEIFEKISSPEHGELDGDIVLGYSSLSFVSLCNWFDKAKKCEFDLTGYDTETCYKAKKVLEESGTTQEELGKFADVCGSIIRKHNIFTIGDIEYAIDDGEFELPCIYVTFRLKVTSDEAATFNEELFTAMVSQFGYISNSIHFSFKPAQ